MPIFWASRIPQIFSNFKNQSCGALSGTTIFLAVAGAGARVFTTLQEVNDLLLIAGNAIAFILNAILFVQIIFYETLGFGKKSTTTSSKSAKKIEKSIDTSSSSATTTSSDVKSPKRKV